ncbi:uncharacterized protein LOC125547238 [Triticum urartu]|uniref:uncharacterized protein LOC125547238 n=1 Tax=Triticum urartu TaxID=4572 RepID=UPI002044933E|nr:uncharacterized protein LOC125547238 [Triticum urartu]
MPPPPPAVDFRPHQLNAGLEVVENHLLDGVVYFADEEGVYSLPLFDRLPQIRHLPLHSAAPLHLHRDSVPPTTPVSLSPPHNQNAWSTWPSATTTTFSYSIDPEETASSSSYFLPELIPLIASRLTTLQDFFALRATCRTYRALLPLSPSNLASQALLLLVPHKASSSEALFHIPLRRILRFRRPRTALAQQDPRNTEFDSFGCPVAIKDSVASHRELRICHQITCERVRLPDPWKGYEGTIFAGNLVLTFNRYHHTLHYCRIGDNHWREARCDEGYRFRDLIFVKGTLYALIYPNYRLAVVKLDNNSVVFSDLGDALCAEIVPYCSMFWLAECHGELLLIVSEYRALRYHVFRLQERKWVRTNSLGGCSLFFNTSGYPARCCGNLYWFLASKILQFAGCLGPDHPTVRRNCLYFIRVPGQCIEYSLVDGSSHKLAADYPGRATEDYGPFAWVLPSIC